MAPACKTLQAGAIFYAKKYKISQHICEILKHMAGYKNTI